MDIRTLINGILRRVPPEAWKEVYEVLPIAKSSLELIDLDELQGEKEILIILTLSKENIFLDFGAAAIKTFEGQDYYVINRTVVDQMTVLPALPEKT